MRQKDRRQGEGQQQGGPLAVTFNASDKDKEYMLAMKMTRRTMLQGWLQGGGCANNNNSYMEDNVSGLATATRKMCQGQQQIRQGGGGTGNNVKEQPSEWQQPGRHRHGQWQGLTGFPTSTGLARTGYTTRTSMCWGRGNAEDNVLGPGNEENKAMGARQWWVLPSGGQAMRCVRWAEEWAYEESSAEWRHEQTRQSSGTEEIWACHWIIRGGYNRRQGHCLRKWARLKTKQGGGLWWGPLRHWVMVRQDQPLSVGTFCRSCYVSQLELLVWACICCVPTLSKCKM